ncbi:MAG: hypothetical protein ACLQIH_17235 [Myxococcaceae bacterium]
MTVDLMDLALGERADEQVRELTRDQLGMLHAAGAQMLLVAGREREAKGQDVES